jgi:transcriptional regulator with XRE-family HTH domain
MEANLSGEIQRCRGELGLSMSAAARAAGVHRLTWRAWEKGESTPEDYNYANIERALQWAPNTVAALIEGRRPATNPVGSSGAVAKILAATEGELDELQQVFAKYRGEEEGDRFRVWANGVRAGYEAQQDSITRRPPEHDPC